MPGYYDVASRVAETLGLREPSYMERLQRFDWRDFAPPRSSYDVRPAVSYDTTSLILGLAVGVGIGIGIGYAVKGNLAPAARRVRERTNEALGDLQNRLPQRLRVTRMEETPTPAQRG